MRFRSRERQPGRGGRRLPLRKSLLGRLLAVSALVAACSVAATAWLAVQTTSGAIRQEQGQNLTDDARIYHALLGRAATHPQWDGVEPTVRALARQYGRRIALTTQSRAPIADSATEQKPPALPPQPSAVVDPLSADSALTPATEQSGGDPADRIDPRAVGPFRLPAAEGAQLQKTADRVVSCLREYGLASDILRTPSGRPRIQVVGNDIDRIEGTRCPLDVLDEPTRSERTALATLNALADACLERQGRASVRLGLDLSWKRDTETRPVPRQAAPSGVLPAPAEPVPAEPAPVVRGPAGSLEDRAIASCVGTARREQLSSYVSSPALLFIGDPDSTTVPGFDLSPANTARIAGAAALVLALTVGASLLAATRLVRPLHALTGAAQRMKDGETTEPVAVTADNEIGRLAAAFNDMSAHRARLETQRRAMVSDVAHELRTPLSNIRGWLEAAEDGLADPDPAFVSSLLEEAVQLQHIIDDLQDLAEADAGALRLHPEPGTDRRAARPGRGRAPGTGGDGRRHADGLGAGRRTGADRGPGAAAAGRRQSGLQRPAPHRARRHRHPARPGLGRRRRGGRGGRRHRQRYPGGRPAVRLRPLLARGEVAQPAHRRQRSRTGDRAQAGGRARRFGGGGQHRGGGVGVHAPAPGEPAPSGAAEGPRQP